MLVFVTVSMLVQRFNSCSCASMDAPKSSPTPAPAPAIGNTASRSVSMASGSSAEERGDNGSASAAVDPAEVRALTNDVKVSSDVQNEFRRGEEGWRVGIFSGNQQAYHPRASSN